MQVWHTLFWCPCAKLGPPYSQGICSKLMASNAQVDPTRPEAMVDSDASRETKMVKDFQLRGATWRHRWKSWRLSCPWSTMCQMKPAGLKNHISYSSNNEIFQTSKSKHIIHSSPQKSWCHDDVISLLMDFQVLCSASKVLLFPLQSRFTL